jgi:ABC-type sulfate transport system substrate-binding protein
MEYKVTFNIDCKDKEEGKEIAESMLNMLNALEPDEFIAVAQFVVEKPNTVNYIKDQLPEIKEMNTISLLTKAGSWIKGIRDALAKDGYESKE